jgi:hypothetical protein
VGLPPHPRPCGADLSRGRDGIDVRGAERRSIMGRTGAWEDAGFSDPFLQQTRGLAPNSAQLLRALEAHRQLRLPALAHLRAAELAGIVEPHIRARHSSNRKPTLVTRLSSAIGVPETVKLSPPAMPTALPRWQRPCKSGHDGLEAQRPAPRARAGRNLATALPRLLPTAPEQCHHKQRAARIRFLPHMPSVLRPPLAHQ